MSRAFKSNPDFLPEVFASSEAAAHSAAEFAAEIASASSTTQTGEADGPYQLHVARITVQDWQSQNGWGVIVAKTRLDAFSHDQMVAEIAALRAAGCLRIAFDMRANRFLSLQTIRYMVSLGEELQSEQGRVSLVAPVEKIKRHFEIYGSLKCVSIVRFVEELTRARESSQNPITGMY